MLVLIDTWWNVNSDTVAKGLTDFRVLIDTWWNVNSIFVDTVDWGWFVLIDTWWNVNFIRKSANYKNGKF